MAHDLDVNPAYLSKAINSIENMNFNCLVNFYRVEKVKELMQQKDSQKYTVEHIYLSSGFRNQSSFNKAFKKQEGITPSEYLKQYVENSSDVDEKKT
jgi:AraC-like DNA-binding protein